MIPKRTIGVLSVLIALIALVGLGTSSCDVTLKAPLDLIQKPRLIASQQVAREVIYANIPVGAQLVRPLESKKNLSAVGSVDWDGDGIDEVYAFYSNATTLDAGVMILAQKDGNWRVTALVEDVGADIAYAEFVDFNLDGFMDVVLGLTAQDTNYKSLSIFEWKKEGVYQIIHKDLYSEVRIEDVDRDERNDIMVFKLDRGQEASATLYRYGDGKMLQAATTPMDAFVSGYYSIQFGKVTMDQYAFLLDFTIGTKSATNILLYKEGQLKLVFDDLDVEARYQLTLKDAPVICADVNGDGLIEIGNRFLPASYDVHNDDPPYLNTWYQWDGERGLQLVMMNYIDELRGFKIDFPERWKQAVLEGKLTMIRSRRFMNRHFVDFYYTPKEATMLKFYTIEILDRATFESRSLESNKLIALTETENTVFAARNIIETEIDQEYLQAFNALMLNPIEMRSLFSLIE